jgi:hypothetical protein
MPSLPAIGDSASACSSIFTLPTVRTRVIFCVLSSTAMPAES